VKFAKLQKATISFVMSVH